MITGKINLGALKYVNFTTKKGAKCMLIPFDANNLFAGEKGIYLGIVAFDIAPEKQKDGQTHLIKQSFSKEKRESMNPEEVKALPIIGSLSTSFAAKDINNNVDPKKEFEENDDLPF